MKFKEIKKRKVYRTWQNKNRRTGLALYIHYSPKNQINTYDFFHFSIHYSKYEIKYSSLDNKQTFTTFEEAQKALEEMCKNL